jgi:2-oxoacid dehydrogenases acyltransferase (catalytic domain)
MGASITRLTPLLPSQLHYGMLDAAGRVDMRLSFDHRVVDGATVALALAEMEEVLRGDISRECTDLARGAGRDVVCGPRPRAQRRQRED